MLPLPPPPNCASKLISRADVTESVVKERLHVNKEKVNIFHGLCKQIVGLVTPNLTHMLIGHVNCAISLFD